eukprot:COSAG04_NODE_640_length_11672_cov_32.635358_1_plen_34_part_10
MSLLALDDAADRGNVPSLLDQFAADPALLERVAS